MLDDPYYEARISIPALQAKILQLINAEIIPEMEEQLVTKIIREIFNEKGYPGLRSYIETEVRDALKEHCMYVTRSVLRTEEFNTKLTNRIKMVITAEIADV